MKGFIKCALLVAVFLCVATVAIMITPAAIYADSSISWVGRPTIKLSQYGVASIPSGADTCPTSMVPLFIEGELGVRESCVFGRNSDLRLARYVDSSGQPAYAVAYATDSRFVPVRGLCGGMMRCMYSQSEDVLILENAISPWENGSALINDFSSRLRRHSDNGRYYTFNAPEGTRLLGANQTHRFSTGSASISANGQWGLVELKGLGVAKINIKTGEYKRVAMASSGIMLPGSLLEMTISDDGRYVALGGRGVGLFIYETTDTCGDIPGEAVVPTILPGYEQCRYGTVSSAVSSPRFQRVSVPRFSANGEKLNVYGVTSTGILAMSLSPSRTDLPVNPLYIAFGDSFTSGEGEFDDYYYGDTNTPQNHCHNSSRSYPFILGEYWSIPTTSVACSGSRTSEVINASAELLRKNSMLSPTVMSVGIGGNDIDLVGKLKSCLSPGTCEWATPARRAATATEIRSILPKMVDLLNEVSKGFAAPPTIVMGYPTIINPDNNASCGPILSAMLDAQERRYMHETILYLNAVLRQAASYAKAYFIDTSGAFVGERLCEGRELAMNAIRVGDDVAPIAQLPYLKLIGAESFHPTPYGHARIIASSIDTLDEFWQNPHCNLCWFEESGLIPDAYWNISTSGQWLDRRQLSVGFLEGSTITSGTAIPFKFVVDTFARDSNVLLELHSEVLELGNYRVANDGSLEGVVTIPSGISGYHTLHALGESASGEQIDLYQTVYVSSEHDLALSHSRTPQISSGISTETLDSLRGDAFGKGVSASGDPNAGALGLRTANTNNSDPSKVVDKSVLAVVTSWPFWLSLTLALPLFCVILTVFIKLKRRKSITRPGD